MLDEPQKIVGHACEALEQKILAENCAWRTCGITPLAISGTVEILATLLQTIRDKMRDFEAFETIIPQTGTSLYIIAQAFCSTRASDAKDAIFSNFSRIYSLSELWALCAIILSLGKDPPSPVAPAQILSSPLLKILACFSADERRQAIRLLSTIYRNIRDGKMENFQRL